MWRYIVVKRLGTRDRNFRVMSSQHVISVIVKVKSDKVEAKKETGH
jgi:hypothetical protein